MIREVAYGDAHEKDRKERHLAAARYFEALGEEELAGALARHYFDAWRAAGAGPEADALAAQARVALRAAADRATNLHSYAQAFAFLKAALDVAVDEAERAALRELAAVAAWHAVRVDELAALLRELIEAYRRMGERLAAARVTLRLGFQLNSLGLNQEAFDTLAPELSQLRPDSDEEERLIIHYNAELARAAFLVTDVNRGLELADLAIAAAERLDELEPLVDALITKGSALAEICQREGHAILYGAIMLADRYQLTRSGLRALEQPRRLAQQRRPGWRARDGRREPGDRAPPGPAGRGPVVHDPAVLPTRVAR